MKIKASLVQPEITKTPFAICEFEIDNKATPEQIRLKAAHKLLENFDIIFEEAK